LLDWLWVEVGCCCWLLAGVDLVVAYRSLHFKLLAATGCVSGQPGPATGGLARWPGWTRSLALSIGRPCEKARDPGSCQLPVRWTSLLLRALPPQRATRTNHPQRLASASLRIFAALPRCAHSYIAHICAFLAYLHMRKYALNSLCMCIFAPQRCASGCMGAPQT
jgi:hypothetical protein